MEREQQWTETRGIHTYHHRYFIDAPNSSSSLSYTSTQDLTTTDNQNPTGSMADLPKDLLAEIKNLEEAFTVDTAKLKAITKHFVSELEKGV